MLGYLLSCVMSAVHEMPSVSHRLRRRDTRRAPKLLFAVLVALVVIFASTPVDAGRRGAFLSTSGSFTLNGGGRGNRAGNDELDRHLDRQYLDDLAAEGQVAELGSGTDADRGESATTSQENDELSRALQDLKSVLLASKGPLLGEDAQTPEIEALRTQCGKVVDAIDLSKQSKRISQEVAREEQKCTARSCDSPWYTDFSTLAARILSSGGARGGGTAGTRDQLLALQKTLVEKHENREGGDVNTGTLVNMHGKGNAFQMRFDKAEQRDTNKFVVAGCNKPTSEGRCPFGVRWGGKCRLEAVIHMQTCPADKGKGSGERYGVGSNPKDCEHCKYGYALMDLDVKLLDQSPGMNVCKDHIAAGMEVSEQAEHIQKSCASRLSTGMVATQSSTRYGGSASRAIDGRSGQHYSAHLSCTHTKKESQPWWKVNFDKEHAINKVEVWNRSDCCSDRLTGAQVRVGSQLCGTLDASKDKQTVSCGGARGRFVEIKKASKSALTLCEVNVCVASGQQPDLVH